jgi:hypothetical protein
MKDSLCLALTGGRQGLRVLKITGIVRAFPIVYYSKRARNAMINYTKTLPSVLLWICESPWFLCSRSSQPPHHGLTHDCVCSA